MSNKKFYAIFLHPDVHPSLLSILDGYLIRVKDNVWLEANSWTQNGAYICANVYQNKTGKTWEINIPINSVLAIANHSDENEIGFRKIEN